MSLIELAEREPMHPALVAAISHTRARIAAAFSGRRYPAALSPPLQQESAIMDEERRTICDECGSWCPTWFAPNAVWNLAIGGPAATDDPGGILCPSCFIAKAEGAGIVPSAWFLTPDENGAALEALQIIADWPDEKMNRATGADMRALARTIIRAAKAKGTPHV